MSFSGGQWKNASHCFDRFRGLPGETITGAPDGLEEDGLAGFRLDLLAQAPDVHVHGAWCDEPVSSPDLVQQAVAAENPPRVRGKEVKKLEFQRTQFNGTSANCHLLRPHVEVNLPDL